MLDFHEAPAPRGARETLLALLLRAILRLKLKPLLSPRVPVRWQRRWLDALSALTLAPRGVERELGEVGGVRGEWHRLRGGAPRAGSLLYLHGGAYCIGSPRSHRALAARLARDTGLAVFVADYRLAPEHPCPAALDDAEAAFRALSPQGPVVLAGDSAGGGLALALAQRLRDAGGPSPLALVLLSPWVDLRPEHTPAPARGEAMLSPAWMQAGARHYAGALDPSDPHLSPLLGELAGLPPTLIQCGSDEALCAQSRDLHARLGAAGVQARLDVTLGRWHVYQAHAGVLPSADAAVARIARFLLVPLAHSLASTPARRHRVLVLGAGMSGLCMAVQLKRSGCHDFLILEKSEGLGGTWWDNRYPGAQVDVPAPAYSFSFAPNPRWRQRFADAAEIQAYMQALAEREGLLAHLCPGTRIECARFDEARACWQFHTEAGAELEARFFACSTGPLSQPRWPDLPGLSDFRGRLLHSARWPDGERLPGLRVGVIGTGSTGAQLIPELAQSAARLHVFQRSANWVLPRLNRRYFGIDRLLMRLPCYARAVRAFWVQALELGRRGFEPAGLMRRFMLWQADRHRRSQLADPALRAALTPDYPLGCRRIIYSNDYYPALRAEQTELVTQPIRRVLADGVELADGSTRALDALVCATGFDTVHLLGSLQVEGRGGRLLQQAWAQGPEAFHGIGVHGFPNLFLLLGPNTATGHTSTLLYIEPACRHALICMAEVEARGAASIEVEARAQAAHNAALQARLADSVWSRCTSWYRLPDGRVGAIFPGYTREYVRGLRRLGWSDYRFQATGMAQGTVAR